jgi:hypothetical protein
VIFVVPPSPSPSPASGPGITGYLTGYGTVALAFVTVLALVATIWITTTDRRRADRERRRDRQQDAARRLLGLMSALIPHMWVVPGVHLAAVSPFMNRPGANPLTGQVAAAVFELEYGAHAEVAGLGDARAAGQYRELARLTMDAAVGIRGVDGRRVAGDLRRYALFVRVSLENLIENGQSIDPGNPAAPKLDRPGDQTDLWEPEHKPQPWLDALKREVNDPLYEHGSDAESAPDPQQPDQTDGPSRNLHTWLRSP